VLSGRHGTVNSDRAAAQHGDLPSGYRDLLLPFQILLPGKRVFLARDAQPHRLFQSGADDDRLVVLEQRSRIGYALAGSEINGAKGLDKLDIPVRDLRVEPVIRDEPHHTAQPLPLFVHGHLVAALREHAGGAETRRPHTDYRNLFAVALRCRETS